MLLSLGKKQQFKFISILQSSKSNIKLFINPQLNDLEINLTEITARKEPFHFIKINNLAKIINKGIVKLDLKEAQLGQIKASLAIIISMGTLLER